MRTIGSKHLGWDNADCACTQTKDACSSEKVIKVSFKGADLTLEQICFERDLFTCRTAVDYGSFEICQYFVFDSFEIRKSFGNRPVKHILFLLFSVTTIPGSENELMRAKFRLGLLALKQHLGAITV